MSFRSLSFFRRGALAPLAALIVACLFAGPVVRAFSHSPPNPARGAAVPGGYGSEITALAFLPDATTVFAACLDGKLHVYEAQSGKERAVINAHKGGVWTVALSPDGKSLASGGNDDVVRLWDANTFREVRSFQGHANGVLAAAFSPDGKWLASGGGDRSIRIWDLQTGTQKLVWHAHELKVLSLAFSADGKRLVSAGVCTAALPGFARGGTHSDQVRLWDVETGGQLHAYPQRGTTVSFSPDGLAVVAAGEHVTGTPVDGGGVIVNRTTQITINPVPKDVPWMQQKSIGSTFALSADGRLLAAANGTRLHLLQQGKGLRFNDAGFENCRTSLWETATAKEIMQLPDTGATVVAISPDGKKLVSGSIAGEVRFLDLAPESWKNPESGHRPTASEMDKLWTALADEEASPAYTAIWTLAAAGPPAVELIGQKLQPVKDVAVGKVADLLVSLDSDKYNVREAAFRDLKNLGSGIEAEVVRVATDKKTSREVRKRLQSLLDAWEKRPATADEIRQARAVHLLERMATPEARAVLARLAEGAAGAWLTEQARAAVNRLKFR